VASFARGFDRLVACGRTRSRSGYSSGCAARRSRATPGAFGLRFNPQPPYNVLATDRIDFATMQRLVRFARYWDLVANSGRFTRTLPLLLADSPFASFLALADRLYAAAGRTHAIASERLYEHLHAHLLARGVAPAAATEALAADYLASGARGKLGFVDIEPLLRPRRSRAGPAAPRLRQQRHRHG